jgi:hypothetical protein
MNNHSEICIKETQNINKDIMYEEKDIKENKDNKNNRNNIVNNLDNSVNVENKKEFLKPIKQNYTLYKETLLPYKATIQPNKQY